MDSQLMGEKQDLSTLLSDFKAHVLSIYYSVLHTEGAQYMFAVCDAAEGISVNGFLSVNSRAI